MICKSALSLMGPYLDGELDVSQSAEVQRHLDECESCAAAHSRLSGLTADLRTSVPRYDASEDLRARVLNGVRAATADTRSSPAWWPARAWAIAATILLAVSAGWNLMLLRSHAEAAVTQEIVSSHVRSLMGNHLLDVPSTDQHNVKPWFDGKLDYAPDVEDFATEGFALIGGRVDYVEHRPTAALVYKRRQHVINLFVWPSGSPPVVAESANGFNLVVWNKAGMDYCAVSDLNEAELRQFADLYRK